MAKQDIHGRAYARYDDLRAGDIVQVDDGFTCILPNAIRKVGADKKGVLYVRCGGSQRDDDDYFEPRSRPQVHHHTLDGQDDGDGYLVGVYRAEACA